VACSNLVERSKSNSGLVDNGEFIRPTDQLIAVYFTEHLSTSFAILHFTRLEHTPAYSCKLYKVAVMFM